MTHTHYIGPTPATRCFCASQKKSIINVTTHTSTPARCIHISSGSLWMMGSLKTWARRHADQSNVKCNQKVYIDKTRIKAFWILKLYSKWRKDGALIGNCIVIAEKTELQKEIWQWNPRGTILVYSETPHEWTPLMQRPSVHIRHIIFPLKTWPKTLPTSALLQGIYSV